MCRFVSFVCASHADIIGRVRNGETPPFRPKIPKTLANENNVDMKLVDLMQQCWLEDPNIRPQLATVLSKCEEINEGKLVHCTLFRFKSTIVGLCILYCITVITVLRIIDAKDYFCQRELYHVCLKFS